MTAQHTPGPWFALALSDGSTVIEATPPGDEEGIIVADEVNHVGNAALIAAAPDLLAVLKEIVAALVAQAKYGLNSNEIAMLRMAEAAVFKARGEGG